MYRWLRNAHLLLGLFFCTFVLMFGLSSLRFSHEWLPGEPAVTQRSLRVSADRDWDPRRLASELMDSEGLRGGLRSIEETDGGFRFRIERMGTESAIEYDRATGEARIATKVWPFMTMMNFMHTTFGMDHEFGLHNVWGFLMFLTAIALLLLGASGTYLWFKIHKERLIGSILVVLGLAYGLTLIVLIRAA